MTGRGGATDVFALPRQYGLEVWLFNRSQRWRRAGGNRYVGAPLRAAWLVTRMSQNPTLGRRLPVAVARQTYWQVRRRVVGRPMVVRMAPGYRIELPTWSHLAGMTLATGLHEPREQLFARAYLRTGDTALDVGANIGLYTVMMASTGARVVAFEPGSRSRADLARSLDLNPGMDVTVVPVALSDKAGQMGLTLSLESNNHLVEGVPSEAGAVGGTEWVQVTRLDDYLAGEPVGSVAFVKVDAEGYDLQVLEGAEGLLATQRPTLMVETWGPPTVRDWLEARGYRIYRYDFRCRALREYPRPYERQANILAVHDERLDEVKDRLATAAEPSLALPRIEG